MPVYEYEGKFYDLPDGLTNEQAISRIESHLGIKQAPQEPSVMSQVGRQAGLAGRALYEGFTAPATATLEFARGATNLGLGLIGSERRVPSIAQAQSQMLTDVGLPVPETGVERAAQAGMQSLTGAAGMARSLPGTVFGQDLARQLPAAAVTGATAEPIAEKTKEITGSDLAATATSVGLGALLGSSAGRGVGGLIDRIDAGKQPVATIDSVRQAAQRAYNSVSEQGIVLGQPSAQTMVKNVRNALDDARYLPENAPDVQNVLKRFDAVTSRGNVKFDEIDQLRQMANDLKANQDPNIRRLSGVMVKEIDDFVARLSPKDVVAGEGGIDEAVKTLSNARKDWRNLSRATTIDDILNTAEVRASNPNASESELIRQGFIRLAANKEKMRVFSQDEQNAIKAVAKGGSLDPLLSFVAKFDPTRRNVLGAGAVGAAAYKPEVALPLIGAGVGAEAMQDLLRRRNAQRLMSSLLTGSVQPPPASTVPQGLFFGAMTTPGQ
jgi:hypothetical protein